MTPQTTMTAEATLSKPADITDTNIADINNNAEISWLRENVQQLMDN